MSYKLMTYPEWIQVGVENGWCTAPVCYTHDGLPMTAAEEEEWHDGNDICIHIVRMCHDIEEQQAVEAAHSPSSWRRSNQGL
jgi:hypothetical protein